VNDQKNNNYLVQHSLPGQTLLSNPTANAVGEKKMLKPPSNRCKAMTKVSEERESYSIQQVGLQLYDSITAYCGDRYQLIMVPETAVIKCASNSV
jgi:hypothetical protein